MDGQIVVDGEVVANDPDTEQEVNDFLTDQFRDAMAATANLRQQVEEAEAMVARAEMELDDFVQAVLDTFPGSVVLDVK